MASKYQHKYLQLLALIVDKLKNDTSGVDDNGVDDGSQLLSYVSSEEIMVSDDLTRLVYPSIRVLPTTKGENPKRAAGTRQHGYDRIFAVGILCLQQIYDTDDVWTGYDRNDADKVGIITLVEDVVKVIRDNIYFSYVNDSGDEVKFASKTIIGDYDLDNLEGGNNIFLKAARFQILVTKPK